MTDSASTAGKLLRVYNDQAAAECVGYAADGALLVLLDLVGHKTACRSLWATVVGGARRSFGISGGITVSGGEPKQDRYQAFWAELPEKSAHNLVICHERLLVATTDPKHLRPFYLAHTRNVEAQNVETSPIPFLVPRSVPRSPTSLPRSGNGGSGRTGITRQNVETQNGGTESEADDPPAALADRFAAMLNQALDLPVLPQWAGVLWRVGLRSGLIEPIAAGGDIAAAFRVQPDGEPWGEIMRDAFETGDIAIPPTDLQATSDQETEIQRR